MRTRWRIGWSAALAAAALGGGVVAAAPASAASINWVTPIAECTTYDSGTGLYTAWYGYADTNGTVIVPQGPENQVYGGTDQPQPETFTAGTHDNVFSLVTSSPFSMWIVGKRTAVADYSSAGACATATMDTGAGSVPFVLLGFGLVLPIGALLLSRQRSRTYASLAVGEREAR